MKVRPQPSRRSHGLIPELFNCLVDTEIPARPGDSPPPPEELRDSRAKLNELLEERPVRSLIKLDKDFHFQPKLEPCFETMALSAGSTPAGELPLHDTLALMQGLAYNLKHYPSPNDDGYVMLMHALVERALEREQLSPRDAKKVTAVLQNIAQGKPSQNGRSFSAMHKIRSSAQFKDVEETSRQLTMLTDGADRAATSHISSWNVDLLKDTRTTLVTHLSSMHIPEFSEDSLYKTIKAKLRNCAISRREDADTHIASFIITIPEQHMLQKHDSIKDLLINSLVSNGAEVDTRDNRITVTPEADGTLFRVLSALEKQMNRQARTR